MDGDRERVGSISVLIAEDEDMFAELVTALLERDEAIRLVGRAHNGREAIALARSWAPQVIVMDIGMPSMDGIEATRRIRRDRPATQVVIFTGSDEERDVERAREAGACAYVQKSHIDAVLLAAIHRAATQDGGVARTVWETRRLEPVAAPV